MPWGRPARFDHGADLRPGGRWCAPCRLDLARMGALPTDTGDRLSADTGVERQRTPALVEGSQT